MWIRMRQLRCAPLHPSLMTRVRVAACLPACADPCALHGHPPCTSLATTCALLVQPAAVVSCSCSVPAPAEL